MIERRVLHGDLSPNNFIIHNGIGYFINFDHTAVLAVNTTSTYSPGTVSLFPKFIMLAFDCIVTGYYPIYLNPDSPEHEEDDRYQPGHQSPEQGRCLGQCCSMAD
jgi:hypothetical protein